MVSRQGTKNFRKLWIFGSGHFLIYFLRYYGSKNDRIQKNFFIQKSVFSCLLTRRNDFWNPFILRSYFHNCLPGLLSHIANQLSLLTKKYLTSKVHFDIIYLKITENIRSVTTENTLIIMVYWFSFKLCKIQISDISKKFSRYVNSEHNLTSIYDRSV